MTEIQRNVEAAPVPAFASQAVVYEVRRGSPPTVLCFSYVLRLALVAERGETRHFWELAVPLANTICALVRKVSYPRMRCHLCA